MVDPNAQFYRTTAQVRLPTSTVANDTCVRLTGFPIRPTGLGVPSIGAGSSLQLQLSGFEAALAVQASSGAIWYEASEPLPITPGDMAQLHIPGEADGFPAAMLSAKTAEAFSVEPVPSYQSSPTPVEVQWSAATTPGSRMTLTLIYPWGTTGTEHVYCELVDDGSHILRADVVDGWRAAPVASKQALFERQRVTTSSEGRTHLVVISTLETRAAIEVVAAAGAGALR